MSRRMAVVLPVEPVTFVVKYSSAKVPLVFSILNIPADNSRLSVVIA